MPAKAGETLMEEWNYITERMGKRVHVREMRSGRRHTHALASDCYVSSLRYALKGIPEMYTIPDTGEE